MLKEKTASQGYSIQESYHSDMKRKKKKKEDVPEKNTSWGILPYYSNLQEMLKGVASSWNEKRWRHTKDTVHWQR